MGILSAILGTRTESRYDTITEAINAFLTGSDHMPTNTAAGAAVNETAALGVTAVYSAVKLIAWTIASLPLPVYKRLSPRGKERAPSHPLYKLLHDAPNPEQTSFQWRALTSVHQNLWGAGISEIEFDRAGQPVALWPLPPWRVKPRRSSAGAVYYDVELDNGGTRSIPAAYCVVFPALSASSYEWMSPIAVHRETVGMALALSEFGARTFGQGTNPAGIVTHPGKLSEKAEKSLKENLTGYAGLGKSHRVMLLEEGMKFDRVGLPPEDAQYLESRKFSISDIARIYNAPLHMLQDHEKSTSWGTGIEEMNLGFSTFTMRPYLVQWEQEFQRRLFAGDDTHFVEFLIEGLLRGKLSERYAAYVQARNWGWMSANDIREIENMNPLPGDQGDIYFVPLNMQNAKYAGEKPAAPAPASKAPAKEKDGQDAKAE